MIGRAALARPWIFMQLAAALGLPTSRALERDGIPRDPLAEGRELGRALASFLDHAELHFRAADVLERLRFHLSWSGRWLDFGHELWRRVGRAVDVAQARAVIEEFFRAAPRMSERSALVR